MKNFTKLSYIFLFAAFILVRTQTAFGQYERPRSNESSSFKKPNAFFSIGSGVHYKYGLIGLGFGMRIGEDILGELNVGMGAYGFKSGFTAVFNAGSNKKWRPTFGFSRASGIKNQELDVQVVYQLNSFDVKTKMDLAPAFVLVPGFQRVFMFKNGSNLALDIGYAIALNSPSFTFSGDEDMVLIEGVGRPVNQVKLSSTQKRIFELLGPGGLQLGLSFNFGL